MPQPICFALLRVRLIRMPLGKQLKQFRVTIAADNIVAECWRKKFLSRIKQIQALVRNGLYYLTEHADEEAVTDGFDIYDVEQGILTGNIRKIWPKEGKYEVVGSALDGRRIGIVCRLTPGGKVRVITVYEDKPK